MMRRSVRPSCVAALLLGGCNGFEFVGEHPPSSTHMDGTGSAMSAEASTTSAFTEGSTTAFEPPVAECGNGYVEPDEECDDGNLEDGDECSPTCRIPCGIEWTHTVLPPTVESELDAVAVTIDETDAIYAVATLREITVDQDGTTNAEPRVAQVIKLDGTGRQLWAAELSDSETGVVAAGLAADDASVFVGIEVTASESVRMVQLDRDTGDLGWEVHLTSDALPLTGLHDVIVGGAGELLVAATAVIDENDHDVWIGRLNASDGQVQASTTWTGLPAANGRSFDRGGPLARSEDGNVYALAGQYIGSGGRQPVVLAVSDALGPPIWSFVGEAIGTPTADNLAAIAVAETGEVYFAADVFYPSLTRPYTYKLSAAGTELWRLDSRQLGGTEAPAERWAVIGLAIGPDAGLLLAGSYLNNFTIAQHAWTEPWWRAYDGDAGQLCQAAFRDDEDTLVPASIAPADLARTTAGDPVVVGLRTDLEGKQALWVGRFRAR